MRVRSGAPINPMIFGGYMEPATTQVWAEVLTDRKFANAITSAPTPPPANPFFRRFFGEPFKPVGPEGTVEMDTERPFVGKHSPRVKLDSAEPHGIRQSRLRVGANKAYEGRVILAGDPGAKITVRLAWGPGCRRLTNYHDPFAHHASTRNSPSSSLPAADAKKPASKSSAPVRPHFTSAPYP